MSTPHRPLLLESGATDNREQEIVRLRRENERLLREVDGLHHELKEARRQATVIEKSVAHLRSQLSPLHNALRMVFGEIDAVIGPADTGTVPSPKSSAVWESWKHKFGGGTAKVIDALLLHGEMNTTQLSIATGLHRTTIPALIFKLNKASLINKNQGKFSLKEL